MSLSCPKCEATSTEHELVKVWKIVGRGGNTILIQLWKCISCKKTWRRYIH